MTNKNAHTHTCIHTPAHTCVEGQREREREGERERENSELRHAHTHTHLKPHLAGFAGTADWETLARNIPCNKQQAFM